MLADTFTGEDSNTKTTDANPNWPPGSGHPKLLPRTSPAHPQDTYDLYNDYDIEETPQAKIYTKRRHNRKPRK